MPDRKYFSKVSSETNFRIGELEKLYRLVVLLSETNRSNLRDSIILRGGTAINLCYQQLPRLSVDIDLAYSRNGSKELMQRGREEVRQKLTKIFKDEDYEYVPYLNEYALDRFELKYKNASGSPDKIKVEVNYITCRIPVYGVVDVKPYNIFDKYENSDSSTYVGDNAVEWVSADHLRRHINVFINPDKEAAGFAVPTETSVNGIPVVIDYGKIQLISCVNNDNQDECDPLVGGISIADQNRVPDLNTLGYKASIGSTVGFVMAGHSADGVDSTIVQPGDDENREVGTVEVHCNSDPNCSGDMAFASATETIVNEIFSSTGTRTIVDKTDGAEGEHQLGTFVKKLGAATDGSVHEIDDWNSNLHYYRAELITGDVDNGDSGSPVFTGTSDVDLYGMAWAKSEGGGKTWIKYYPQDYIEEQIGAVPALE